MHYTFGLRYPGKSLAEEERRIKEPIVKPRLADLTSVVKEVLVDCYTKMDQALDKFPEAYLRNATSNP